MSESLTYKQKHFCLEYIKDKNATQAAIRAGYAENSANQQGPELLVKLGIQNEINRLLEQQAQRCLITADLILTELLALATIDPRQAYDGNGNLLNVKDLPDGLAKAISSIEVFIEFDKNGKTREQKGITQKIKFWDKNKALENLAKHLRLITEKFEHTGKDGGPIQTSILNNWGEKDLIDFCERIIKRNAQPIPGSQI
jgi:phage terminase small subunit